MQYRVIGAMACCLGSVALTLAADVPAEDRGKVIGVLEDFDKLPSGPFQKGFLDSWRWTDELRARARDSSQLEIVDVPASIPSRAAWPAFAASAERSFNGVTLRANSCPWT